MTPYRGKHTSYSSSIVDGLLTFSTVKSTGKAHTKTKTGSQRDHRVGKGRYDLLSPIVERRDAMHMENGARKYGERNWEKGQPLSLFLDSARRHLRDALMGKTDEDHWAAARWNLACIIHGEEMIRVGVWPKEYADLPRYHELMNPPRRKKRVKNRRAK